MNGLQVGAVTRSSQANAKTPLYVVAAGPDKAVEARAQALGDSRLLQKPLEPAAIAALIAERWVTKPAEASAFDARLINAVLASVAEVFAFYLGKEALRFGRPVATGSGGPERTGLAGLITIGGASFAGSMALAAPLSVVEQFAARLLPPGTQVGRDMLDDVMGEIANQVCGRIKGALARLGIKSAIGLPEVIGGERYKIAHKVESAVLRVPLEVAGARCEVEFCLAAGQGFVIDEAKSETVETGVLMF
jgi:CheY-specific phosphatase CheX